MNTTGLTQEQIETITEKVNALIAKGNTQPFEKLFNIYASNMRPKQVMQMTSKDVRKMEQREKASGKFTGITYEGVTYNNIHDYNAAVSANLKKSI